MITKILPTIGPKTQSKLSIKKILKYTKVVRSNSSHNTLEWHSKISKIIKLIDNDTVHLLDIPGIKPRTDNIKEILIKRNEHIMFYYELKEDVKSIINKIKITKPLPVLKKIPKKFSISDGQFNFKIIKLNKNFVIGRSTQEFLLLPKKGINIEGGIYDDTLQLKHYKNFLNKAKKISFDAIGLSFVQSDNVIDSIKKIYKDKIIVSKIENLKGLENLKEIISSSDVIMIDRGDLGAEIGQNNLFDAIIEISNEVKKAGKPLIIATENLDSMRARNEPTKSEIISLSLGNILGSDYVMLSDETATYKNWLNILKWLDKYQKKQKIQKYKIVKKNFIKESKKTKEDINSNSLIFSSISYNLKDPIVFFTRNEKIIIDHKKLFTNNKYFIFTDSIKVKNLCNFWSNVTPFYIKSFGKLHKLKEVLRLLKKQKNILFKDNVSKIVCIINVDTQKKILDKNIYIIKKEELN